MIYLLPNLLGEGLFWKEFFPINVLSIVKSLDYLIAESEKSAYRYYNLFLKKSEKKPVVFLLNEHTNKTQILDLVEKTKSKKTGLIADCGLPCIADPGADLVFFARQKKTPIIAIAGPSSIVMALMLSGFSAQNFCFNGYLPRKEKILIEKLKRLERDSKVSKKTHIWIEAPYRTRKMLEVMLDCLQDSTFICVAQNITTKKEKVITATCKKWREQKEQIQKGPAIFLLQVR